MICKRIVLINGKSVPLKQFFNTDYCKLLATTCKSIAMFT